MGKGRRGERRPASGDRSGGGEERGTETEKQREKETEDGQAHLLKGNIMSVYRRCS